MLGFIGGVLGGLLGRNQKMTSPLGDAIGGGIASGISQGIGNRLTAQIQGSKAAQSGAIAYEPNPLMGMSAMTTAAQLEHSSRSRLQDQQTKAAERANIRREALEKRGQDIQLLQTMSNYSLQKARFDQDQQAANVALAMQLEQFSDANLSSIKRILQWLKGDADYDKSTQIFYDNLQRSKGPHFPISANSDPGVSRGIFDNSYLP